MKGQPRRRPAPVIGQRVVVRFVPLPPDRVAAWNAQVVKMMERGANAQRDGGGA